MIFTFALNFWREKKGPTFHDTVIYNNIRYRVPEKMESHDTFPLCMSEQGNIFLQVYVPVLDPQVSVTIVQRMILSLSHIHTQKIL